MGETVITTTWEIHGHLILHGSSPCVDCMLCCETPGKCYTHYSWSVDLVQNLNMPQWRAEHCGDVCSLRSRSDICCWLHQLLLVHYGLSATAALRVLFFFL